MAFWVMIYHIKEVLDIPYLSVIINKGYLGVDVFFILSGYVLAHVYVDKFNERLTAFEYLSFIQKRFARIYPLHIVTMVGAVILGLIINKYGQASNLYLHHIPYHILLIHSWGFVENSRLNFPSWSISAEWFAYLLAFPLATYMFRSRFLIGLSMTLLSFVVFQLVTFFYFSNNFDDQIGFGIARIFPEFLIGVALYRACVNSSNKYLTFTILGTLVSGIFGWFYLSNLDYFMISIIPIVIYTLHHRSKILYPFFGTKVPVFLGELSFSMYMTHFFARKVNGIIHHNLFGEELNSPILVFNYVLLTLLFSLGTYYIIEIPCRKYINQFNAISK